MDTKEEVGGSMTPEEKDAIIMAVKDYPPDAWVRTALQEKAQSLRYTREDLVGYCKASEVYGWKEGFSFGLFVGFVIAGILAAVMAVVF